MPAELSKEQVEELLKRVQCFVDARDFHSDDSEPNFKIGDLRALLTLARSAPSAELVKLGEAAVEFKRALNSERPDVIGCYFAFEQAARTYARTVEGNNNGR